MSSATPPVQKAYAQLLDQDRGYNDNAFASLYGVLDLQNAATIQATLESWAPRTETHARCAGHRIDRQYVALLS